MFLRLLLGCNIDGYEKKDQAVFVEELIFQLVSSELNQNSSSKSRNPIKGDLCYCNKIGLVPSFPF